MVARVFWVVAMVLLGSCYGVLGVKDGYYGVFIELLKSLITSAFSTALGLRPRAYGRIGTSMERYCKATSVILL